MYYYLTPVGRVFDIDPGDPGSIPGHVILMALKMVLDTSLLNTIEKRAFWSPSTKGRQLYLLIITFSNIEQVLAATPHKAPTIRSPTAYHENYPS